MGRFAGYFLILFTPMLVLTNCAFVFPPVTVTGSKTAAEKQIVGEQNELEKDVWMISSAKTSGITQPQGDDVSEEEGEVEDEENTFVYKAFAILDLFGPYLAELKRDRVVGENNEGLLTIILNKPGFEHPDEVRKKYSAGAVTEEGKGKHYRILTETVEQINVARGYLIRGYVLNQKKLNPDYKANPDELRKIQREKYQGAALKGEYIQLDSGKWIVK